jgi:hypothetical protein
MMAPCSSRFIRTKSTQWEGESNWNKWLLSAATTSQIEDSGRAFNSAERKLAAAKWLIAVFLGICNTTSNTKIDYFSHSTFDYNGK